MTARSGLLPPNRTGSSRARLHLSELVRWHPTPPIQCIAYLTSPAQVPAVHSLKTTLLFPISSMVRWNNAKFMMAVIVDTAWYRYATRAGESRVWKLISSTEIDRAYENLQKSGKGFMGGRREYSRRYRDNKQSPPFQVPGGVYAQVANFSADGRVSHGSSHRSHSMNHFDEGRSSRGADLHNFYAAQRHQSSRGSNEAEQVMQAKRRMAAQRERELRNLHTEQQYQRSRPPSTL